MSATAVIVQRTYVEFSDPPEFIVQQLGISEAELAAAVTAIRGAKLNMCEIVVNALDPYAFLFAGNYVEPISRCELHLNDAARALYTDFPEILAIQTVAAHRLIPAFEGDDEDDTPFLAPPERDERLAPSGFVRPTTLPHLARWTGALANLSNCANFALNLPSTGYYQGVPGKRAGLSASGAYASVAVFKASLRSDGLILKEDQATAPPNSLDVAGIHTGSDFHVTVRLLSGLVYGKQGNGGTAPCCFTIWAEPTWAEYEEDDAANYYGAYSDPRQYTVTLIPAWAPPPVRLWGAREPETPRRCRGLAV